MKNLKNYLVFLIFFVLFCAYLTTLLITSELLAKYTSMDTSSKMSTVADFDVDVTLKDAKRSISFDTSYELSLVPGSNEYIDINLDGTNNEVKVKCIIDIELISIIPIKITYNNEDVKDNDITVYITPGEILSIENILISWDELDNNYIYSGMASLIKINILIEQVD